MGHLVCGLSKWWRSLGCCGYGRHLDFTAQWVCLVTAKGMTHSWPEKESDFYRATWWWRTCNTICWWYLEGKKGSHDIGSWKENRYSVYDLKSKRYNCSCWSRYWCKPMAPQTWSHEWERDEDTIVKRETTRTEVY